MSLPDEMIDEETGGIQCFKCGGTAFDIRPKKLRRDGKIWQRVVCVKCGDWFLAGDIEDDNKSR